jgi:hypothetical protein
MAEWKGLEPPSTFSRPQGFSLRQFGGYVPDTRHGDMPGFVEMTIQFLSRMSGVPRLTTSAANRPVIRFYQLIS